MIKHFEGDGMAHHLSIDPRQSEVRKRLVEKLQSINRMAANIINHGLQKAPLDKERLNYIWQDNKVLREIYAEHFRFSSSHMSFDDYINPPYGWEIALRDWD